MALTKEQAEIVEKNHSLIYFCLKKFKYPIDDYYDVAAIGLCNAAIAFQAEKGFAFSSYAIRTIRNTLYLETKLQHLKHRTAAIVSFDGPVDGTENLCYQDLISDPTVDPADETFAQVFLKDEAKYFRRLVDDLPEKHRTVIMLRMSGKTQREIADEIGSKQTTVCRIIGRFQKKFYKFAGGAA